MSFSGSVCSDDTASDIGESVSGAPPFGARTSRIVCELEEDVEVIPPGVPDAEGGDGKSNEESENADESEGRSRCAWTC